MAPIRDRRSFIDLCVFFVPISKSNSRPLETKMPITSATCQMVGVVFCSCELQLASSFSIFSAVGATVICTESRSKPRNVNL